MGDVEMTTMSCRARRRRTVATVAAATALVFGLACSSSKPARVVEAAPAEAASVQSASTANTAAAEIRAMELREGAPEVYLDLGASAPLVWTSFRNADGQVVLELPNSQPGSEVGDLAPSAGLVASVRVERDSVAGKPLTRLVIQTRSEVEHAVSADGVNLELRLSPLELAENSAGTDPSSFSEEPTLEASADGSEAPTAATQSPYETESSTEARGSEPAASDRQAEFASLPLGTPDEPAVAPTPRGRAATELRDVSVARNSGETVVTLAGNGEFAYSTFVLEAPRRFVVDLTGVVNRYSRSAVPVGGAVDRIRVAQFKSPPSAVSRVVFDLTGSAAPRVERRGSNLAVSFGGANGSNGSNGSNGAPREEPPARSAAISQPPPPPPALGEPDDSAVESEDVEPSSAEPTDLSAARRPVRNPPPASPRPSAAATAPPAAPPTPSASESFISTSQALGATERKYVGDPIDLKVTNADITDVLRSLAQLSGLNIVVQPGVTGTVTAELENVPWDQAFEEILKINGLGYELEGNVMRIAPRNILRQEAQERQELAVARALSVPLRTVMKRLSYANAGQVAGVLRTGQAGILSQRGSVLVDERTNTLIIKEIPTFLDTVIAVIENLDTPEPQVMIEARIIETTKRFSRSLGIQWGFTTLADAAHGNTTGLIFPNNVRGTGGVNLNTGGNSGAINLRLGNVLNTFTLDIQLQAAESEGLINILSAPKVATLNNQRASIQSGVQIPVQTVANNTVTVQFINATLRLDVVPQITAEGTILMQIDIFKREPQLGLLVPGAQNAPIATKEASTRVIVRDGGTTVIGGIYKVTTDDGEARVPGLANIPILGNLFKNRTARNENEELLIFITPRIIKL